MKITKKPIASYPILYDLSIFIYGIEYGIDDYVIAGWSDEKICRRYKLYNNDKGTYFNLKGIRYYLHDFIRLDLF